MEQNMKTQILGNTPTKVRKFAGKTEFKLDYSTTESLEKSKQERHFYQRMLRAYLKGKNVFHFGFHYDAILKMRVQTEHEVLVIWEDVK